MMTNEEKIEEIKKHLRNGLIDIQKAYHLIDTFEEIMPSKPEKIQKSLPGAVVEPVSHTQRGKIKGGPRGAVIHFTAGQSAFSALDTGKKNGHYFMSIERNGQWHIPTGFSIDSWGYHCGESKWPDHELGGFLDCNRELMGIELVAGGRLTLKNGHWETWFEKRIPIDQTRYVETTANIKGGTYHIFTPEQEKSLIDLLMFLKNNNPDRFNFDFVLGHDEVSGPQGLGYWRKTDPGAALSMTMPEFRKLLKKKYEGN